MHTSLLGALTSLLALLLALTLAAAPTVDVACRALCTPPPIGTAAPSCHEVGTATADGVLVPAMSCHHDAVAAVDQVEGARNRVAAAPLGTLQATVLAYLPAPAGADRQRQSVRPRLPYAYPSTVVLRI